MGLCVRDCKVQPRPTRHCHDWVGGRGKQVVVVITLSSSQLLSSAQLSGGVSAVAGVNISGPLSNRHIPYTILISDVI